jgi:16S rRNA (adenine1518-N6/adenine1519-N6)-dimethyltransferase
MNDRVGAKKSLGQHWLDDQASLEAMCDAAEVRAGDTVLEIGPGKGTLTTSLLNRGAAVVAVELDERLAQDLRIQFKNKPFILNMLSILEYDFSSLPAGYKIVANIPYYLTSHLLRLLSETPNPPSQMALLVQKEVAERVVASPGAMSLLAVSVQLYYEAKAGSVVKAELFSPSPKVDSQILILKSRVNPLFPDLTGSHPVKFFRVVKAGFSERRKKLRSSLAGGLHTSKEEAEELLKKSGIDPNLRAQALSLDDWHRLYESVRAK